MKRLKAFALDLFVTNRWFAMVGGLIALFVVSFFFPALYIPAQYVALAAAAFTVADGFLLWATRGRLTAERIVPARLSLGDYNTVRLTLYSTYAMPVTAVAIDELPVQMQERRFRLTMVIPARGTKRLDYSVRPTHRGVYSFGSVLVYVASPLRLLRRRMAAAGAEDVKVYPSFVQMRKHSLLAVASQVTPGARKIRRLGHSLEFEKIKEYVPGDDVRSINWKATARRGGLMVNTYTDARQQQVIVLLDKGRTMRAPFDGLTLLDYAINATLALLNVVLLRSDRAGLITFAEKVKDIVPPERTGGQLGTIMETLYAQQTAFLEPDYEAVWTTVHRRVAGRSFLLLFTSFESLPGMQRHLPYLRQLASRHLLCVVFFQNTLLNDLRAAQPDTLEGVYIQTIADRFDYEKRQIVKELRRHGILSVLTTPANLSVDVINKYLELKARQMV